MSEAKLQAATKKKEEGNEAVRDGNLTHALACYNQSLTIVPLAVTYNNRALVFMKLDKYEEAIKDINIVIEKEPNNWKAFYRRCLCRRSLDDMVEALEDVKRCLQVSPECNKWEVKKLYKDVEASMKKKTPTSKAKEDVDTSKKKLGERNSLSVPDRSRTSGNCSAYNNHRLSLYTEDVYTGIKDFFRPEYLENPNWLVMFYGSIINPCGYFDRMSPLTDVCHCQPENSVVAQGVYEVQPPMEFNYDEDYPYDATALESEKKVYNKKEEYNGKKCTTCKRSICYLWNWRSKAKSCVSQTCSVLELFKGHLRNLFPNQSQAIHDYGFCNMVIFYNDEYFSDSLLDLPATCVLLGLYISLMYEICGAAEGRHKTSFPASLEALHQAYEKNRLDAYLQQFIADMNRKGDNITMTIENKTRNYLDMWVNHKYIIGPTCLPAHCTFEEIESARDAIFEFYYGK